MKKLFLLLCVIICATVCLSQERFTIGDLIFEVKNNAEVKVYKCNKSATVVDIPNSVRYKLRRYDVTSIGFGAFENCTNLLSVVIPNSINEIEACAFSYCSALNSIDIPNSISTIETYTFKACIALKAINLPNSVTHIKPGAFFDCINTISITVPNSVVSIDRSAFENCSSLVSVNIPEGIDTIESSVFSNCRSLTSITIPNSATYISAYAFYNCTSLTSFTIPQSVRVIGNDAFLYTAFYNDSSNWTGTLLYKDNCLLEARRIKGKYSIPDGIRLIADYAFFLCDSLKSIYIPNSVTCIGRDVFGSCRKLESVSIGTHLENISEKMFYGCESLLTIIIPESVTTIGYGAFGKCIKLESITIPKNVNYIGDFAFNSFDSKLTTIICLPTEPPILEGNDVFTRSNPTTLQVPRGSLERYKASDWNKYFEGRVVEIEE